MTAAIRAMEEADLDGVAELWRESADFHVALDPSFALTPAAVEVFRERLAERLKEGTTCAVVAEVAGDLAGFCLARVAEKAPIFVEREYGFLTDLGVTERFRNEGIGEALVKQVLAWFEEKSVRRVELRVISANVVSSSFWTKMGFRTFAEERCLTLGGG